MKGTLNKTESGWQVWYHAKEDLFYGNTGVRILPLHPDAYSVNGPMKDVVTSWEGQEVEFEIIEFPVNSISKYAKLVDKATRPLTEDDAWLTMKEGDITVNFKPMPEFDDPNYPEYLTRVQQLHIQIAEECFRKYPNNEELYTTDELKDAYKAGVIDGFKEAQNYNLATKKQDNE